MVRTTRKVYYSIGEVANIAGVKPHILRFWESEFSILNPKKNRSGIRAYQERDIQVVLLIKKLLYTEKFTIEGAKKKLKEEKDLVKKHPAPIRQLEVVNILKELNSDLKNLAKEIDEL